MKVSILIPSRNERFLPQTVADVLSKARGEVEVIVILDGYWPEPPLLQDSRLNVIHRGAARGMRPAINAAASIAKGDYLMKLDGHCMVAEGFDEALKAECADNWVVVPRRHRLDAENWSRTDYGKPPIDYHYLSYPLEHPDDISCGLHGAVWPERTKSRTAILMDDEMSSQGSCWFTSRAWWQRMLGPMEVQNYGTFVQEFQEIGLKTWLGGGEVKVNKRTWYAHLHKGKKYGRGYTINQSDHLTGARFCNRHWMLDQWHDRKHDLRWLIEKFAPVPTWPTDLDEAFARARKVYA
ncbi:MAG: glycosyltransferase family 2 protein [Planctomycetes bacterium]|nr:glycosyltransferase family 2 protein [Planctomycetota bacterium]